MTRPDLNELYALEATKKNDPEAYERVQTRMEQAKILVTPTFSLRQHCLEKSPLLFDTVIFDDASMVNETDCLAALSHGANRAIFLGNRTTTQNMFLVNPSSINKTLFYRITEAIDLETVTKANAISQNPSPTRPSPKKQRGKANKKDQNAVVAAPS